MGVGAQNHVAAGRQGLTGILMNNRLIGRHIDSAVLLGGGKAEHMVVLIDGAAYRAQGVVAVGHGIGQRELPQAAGAGRLDNAHIGNVMAYHGVKADAELLFARSIPRRTDIMRTQNLVGDGVLTGPVFVQSGLGGDGFSIEEIYSIRMKCNHDMIESVNIVNASMSAAPPGEIPSRAYRPHMSFSFSFQSCLF